MAFLYRFEISIEQFRRKVQNFERLVDATLDITLNPNIQESVKAKKISVLKKEGEELSKSRKNVQKALFEVFIDYAHTRRLDVESFIGLHQDYTVAVFDYEHIELLVNHFYAD